MWGGGREYTQPRILDQLAKGMPWEGMGFILSPTPLKALLLRQQQWGAKTLSWSQAFVGSDPHPAVDWLCDRRRCKKFPGNFTLFLIEVQWIYNVVLVLKLQKCVSGGSEELRFFMSQLRKNSVRGKMIDKKWFITIEHLWGL